MDNSNVFRSQYRAISEQDASLIAEIKSKAGELLDLIHQGKPGRESSLAATNLEQAVMWATKANT